MGMSNNAELPANGVMRHFHPMYRFRKRLIADDKGTA
jgi:hypothetical protein